MSITDREFMELAITEALKSVSEDGRAHPKVGAIVVKDGQVLATAFRGETALGDHAEFAALERKLQTSSIAGATVYTTLEPCTTRDHPKVPCAERLIERKIIRVSIGMLDPNPEISGKGQMRLRQANIATDFFPSDLMARVEEINRDFIRDHSSSREIDIGLAPILHTSKATSSLTALPRRLAAPTTNPGQIRHDFPPVSKDTALAPSDAPPSLANIFAVASSEHLTDLQKANYRHRYDGTTVRWDGRVTSIQPLWDRDPKSDVLLLLRPDSPASRDLASVLFQSQYRDVLSLLAEGDIVTVEGLLDLSNSYSSPKMRNAQLVAHQRRGDS